MSRSGALGLILAASVVAGGCNTDSPPGGPPDHGEPARLTVVGGNGQTARAGTRLPGAVIVRVEDSRGEALRGVNVAFEVTGGEGTLDAATAKTDEQGEVKVDWTLGPEPGVQEIEARILEPSTGRVLLSAKATATATVPSPSPSP
ncbi:MAG: hypothetical protein WKG32_03745 [Gemmatimonadaceae bacterium]